LRGRGDADGGIVHFFPDILEEETDQLPHPVGGVHLGQLLDPDFVFMHLVPHDADQIDQDGRIVPDLPFKGVRRDIKQFHIGGGFRGKAVVFVPEQTHVGKHAVGFQVQ